MQFKIGGAPEGRLEAPDSDWEATPASVKKIVVALASRLNALEEKVNANSRNSGKPPSSDQPGSLPNRGKTNPDGKKQGGQPGHLGHARRPFEPHEVNEIFNHNPAGCTKCGRSLEDVPSSNYLTHQVAELPKKLFEVVEHRTHGKRCPCCDEVNYGELPEGVSQRKFGPRLTAAIAVMAGTYHMSRRDIVDFVRNVWGLQISLGTVSALEGLATDAMAASHSEVGRDLQAQEALNADGTSWRKGNKYACLWVATCPQLTYYKITTDQTSKSAASVLGSFKGVLTSDRAKNFDFYPYPRQTCWSHLDRHFKRMSEREGLSSQVGLDAMKIADEVFGIWADFKAGEIDADKLFDATRPPRMLLEEVLLRGTQCGNSKTENTCQNLIDIFDQLWTFTYMEGVDPTNNAAERQARPGVVWRKTSYGSQSERGTRFAESILTLTATCKQQGRSVLEFVQKCINAFLKQLPAPSLRPQPAPS